MLKGSVFAVVLTIETLKSNNVTLSVVPSHWMIENILYFPPEITGKTAIEGYIKCGKQAPAVNKTKWKKYAFVIKKRFTFWEPANKYVKQHQNDASETDDTNLKRLRKMQIEINKVTRKCKGDVFFYNKKIFEVNFFLQLS